MKKSALQVAIDQFKAKRYKEAEDLFLAELSNDDSKGEASYGLGLIDFVRNSLETAEIRFSDAISYNCQVSNSYFYLFRIYKEKGDLVSAKKFLNNCLGNNPGHVAALEAATELGITPLSEKNAKQKRSFAFYLGYLARFVTVLLFLSLPFVIFLFFF